MSKRNAIIGLCVCILAALAGCDDPAPQPPPDPDVVIASPEHDGPINAYRDSMPVLVGFCWGRNASGAAGIPATSGAVLIWRTLYRFDLSGWSAGDAEFYVYCTGLGGNAHGLEAVAVADFDSVPYRVTRSDVSALWNLVGAGQSLGTFTPADTGWVHFTIPAAQLADAKAATGYVALVVKAANEAIVPGNQVDLGTWESTGFPKPYLAW